MAVPNSEKVRKTKTRLDWFYDPHRSQWRFLPSDLTHRAEYEQVDAAGEPLQPARTHEHKGWIPAAQAVQGYPDSHKTIPEHLRHLLPEKEKVSA